MSSRARRIAIPALCSVLAVSACERGQEAGVARGGPGAEAANDEVLWTQTLLDSARAGFDSDTAAIGRALRSAAALARREAAAADGAARNALTRSAEDLDRLGVSIASGTRHARESVDSAFARLQQADGLHSLAGAADAWASGQRVRAGEKLEAGADNLDQAANNARYQLDTINNRALADARQLADRLRNSQEVLEDEFHQATSELEARLNALADRIGPQT